MEHLTPLFSIHHEIDLLEEIKDVQDEIDILLSLLYDQESVINRLPGIARKRPWISQGQDWLPSTFQRIHSDLVTNEEELEAMQRWAGATKSAINNLLNLKQKQANSLEVRSAREAEFETARDNHPSVHCSDHHLPPLVIHGIVLRSRCF